MENTEKKVNEENAAAKTPEKETLKEKIARKKAEAKDRKAAKKAAKEAEPKRTLKEKLEDHKGAVIGAGLLAAAVVGGIIASKRGGSDESYDPDWGAEPGDDYPEAEDEVDSEETPAEEVNEE